jgi:hypothetical protein
MPENAVLNFFTDVQITEQGNERVAEAVGGLDTVPRQAVFTNVIAPPAPIVIGILAIYFRFFGKELVGAGLNEIKEAQLEQVAVYRELACITHLDRLAFTHCQPEAGCTVHFHDVTLTELGDFFNAGTAVVQDYRYPVRHCPIRCFFTVEDGQMRLISSRL